MKMMMIHFMMKNKYLLLFIISLLWMIYSCGSPQVIPDNAIVSTNQSDVEEYPYSFYALPDRSTDTILVALDDEGQVDSLTYYPNDESNTVSYRFPEEYTNTIFLRVDPTEGVTDTSRNISIKINLDSLTYTWAEGNYLITKYWNEEWGGYWVFKDSVDLGYTNGHGSLLLLEE